MINRSHVAVVGAGAFGGWSALFLLRKGFRVTLLDAWGPANSRASSGNQTRVMRAIYGGDEIYVELAARAVSLWKEAEERWNRTLFRRIGVLWMVSAETRFVEAALPFLSARGMPFREFEVEEAARRYPQINFEGVRRVILEPEMGYLLARWACQIVVAGFLAEGGEYMQVAARPGEITKAGLSELVLSDGSRLFADQYIFACGAWMGELFPRLLEDRIRPTRQEVFLFAVPGDARFWEDRLPVWIECGERLTYGIPGSAQRGFKVADDTRGGRFDPNSEERNVSDTGLQLIRKYLSLRFPALAGAPLAEGLVCQYENSPDGHFILDRHPEAQNVWLVGGGSGHGFKHGPGVGELVAQSVGSDRSPLPCFRLTRF